MKLKISLLFVIAFFASSSISNAQQELTLQDIWSSGKYAAKSINALNNLNDGQHYTTLNNVDGHAVIQKFNYKTGQKVADIINSTALKNPINNEELKFDDYQFSDDENKLLITTNSIPLYRHSFEAAYAVVDVKSNKVSFLDNVVKQRLPAFNKTASHVAYVQNNNLYVLDLQTNVAQQITFDGKRNAIINGATDWVYEEEFGFDRAFFWNTNGTKIAYFKFDEREVKEFNMPMYTGLYPQDNKFKYPKAGEKNSVVSVYIYDLKTNKSAEIPFDKNSYEYIPRIMWANENELLITTMNRKQTELTIHQVNVNTLSISPFYSRKDSQYIDITVSQANFYYVTADSKNVILLDDADDYMHIYKIDFTSKKKTLLTQGDYDVKGWLGVDEKNKLIYYKSAQDGPSEEHVYSISFDGKTKRKLSDKKGFNKLSFSKDYSYFINTHSDLNTPYTITLHDTKTLKQLRVIEDNAILKETLKQLKFNAKEMFSFTTSQQVKLNGWMIKPKNFDATKKYPVFQYYYGGPGKNEVEQKWGGANYMWHQFLAQQGFVVVCVDNRGTGQRGNAFKKSTYKQLGKLEVEDQIEVAKYLSNLSFIDKNKIACMGWSFGGYLTSLCMTKGADYFKAGIAVAPVTNWRFYDSIYTERFLETPQENASGYDDNSPINFADRMRNPFLLVHGSADDNVHLQNSMEMSEALVNKNIPFEQFIYTDKNHSIFGGKTRLHLYTKMYDFLKRSLNI